jgi:hypothetical protein
MSETGDNHILTVWTIYRSPLDFPGKWVLRGHDVERAVVEGQIATGARPHRVCFVTTSLEACRAQLPPGVLRFVRQTDDDPAIYESWL